MSGYLGPGVTTQIDGYTQSQTDAKLTPTNVSDKDNASTGAFDLPSGTTAQRPASPNTGYTRYNTTIGAVETWNGTAWVTSGGLVLQAVQTASFTAVAGNSYPVNTTSAAITVTLPASPTAGQQVNVFDYAGTAGTNYITINPNGGKINGVSTNAVISTVRASVTLVYVDATQGWVDVAVGNAAYIAQSYSASYLVVGGGAGGGYRVGGGGGAGGVLTGAVTLNSGTIYSITVGAGGAGATSQSAPGGSGSNSVLSSSTAIGGGGGGSFAGNGVSGGSGGGSSYGYTPGSGTSGQGYAGGNSTGSIGEAPAGGGGGAGGIGGDRVITPPTGGAGGVGVASSITGSSLYYAGGGGGGCVGTGGAAGNGGGGAGAGSGGGISGTANKGGGGGGGSDMANGGNGGSGVVILSIPTANYSGVKTGSPTVTTSGSNTILTFTSSGSYTA